MSPERGDGRPSFIGGAEEAARLAQEVQELGFEAARAVVDRFSDLFGQFCAAAVNPTTAGGRPGTGDQPRVHLGADSGAYRRLQSDMQRAADSYLSVLSQLNDLSLRFFDAARPATGDDSRTDSLTLPDVAPGGRTSARMWLHNTTASPVTALRAWTPGLTSHAGDVLPDGSVTFTPDLVTRLEAGDSREILVVVRPGNDAVPGAYHAQILVEGLPEAAFPLAVRVLPRAPER